MDPELVLSTCNHPAPPTAQESERLLALQQYCILDTPPEPIFDSLTSLGAALFKVPTVLISLVQEHRQFFKSVVGFDRRETSRDSSFCAYTILTHQPFVVLNALEDPRFQTNELVLGAPFVRFYAGAPLIGHDGLTLGSFCVLSNQPRCAFSESDQQSLQQLAALTVEALEQRLYPARIAKAEQALREANERYRLAARATTDGIWDWNYTDGKVYFSARLRAIMGLPEEEYLGNVEEWLQGVHPADAPTVRGNLERFIQSSASSFQSEYRIRHEDSTWRWVHNRGTATRDDNGKLLRLIGAAADVTSRRMRDELTGLGSRASLLSALEQRSRAGKDGQAPCAVLSLDVDQFRRVNDSLGRSCGDLLLLEISQRLRQWLSSQPTDLAARITGDEFAALLQDVPDEHAAMARAEDLLALLESPLTCQGHTVKLSASIGLALCSDRSLPPEELLQNANAAMHRAKAHGGGQIAVFSQSLRDGALERISLESELRTALARNDVALYYQPKFSLQSGQLVGFEALMRWHHRERGSISPAVFIPLAEESDLILEIGRWTMREALRQLAAWRTAGLISPEVTMAVNLSARQFRDRDLLRNVKRKLADHGLPSKSLALEVTEGVLIRDVSEALNILCQLKQFGVGLELDDFGVGYSSLAYLNRFPFDSLKIDRSFINDLTGGNGAIVEAIVALGRSLHLRVIAEGIETGEQRDLLRAMGCDQGQGYLLAHPLPPHEIQKHLAQGAAWTREAWPSPAPRVPAEPLVTSAAGQAKQA